MKHIFKTRGPSFLESVSNSWKHGGWEYFRSNLTGRLRHGRYKSRWGCEDTRYDNFLFSLGVLIMDFWGHHQKRRYKHDRKFRGSFIIYQLDTQYLRHPFFWVRRRAHVHLTWLESRAKSI